MIRSWIFDARPVVAHFLNKTKGSNLWAPSCFTSSWTPAMAFSRSDRHFRTLKPPPPRPPEKSTKQQGWSLCHKGSNRTISEWVIGLTSHTNSPYILTWTKTQLGVSTCLSSLLVLLFFLLLESGRKKRTVTPSFCEIWEVWKFHNSTNLVENSFKKFPPWRAENGRLRLEKTGVPGTWVHRHLKGWKKGVRLQRFGLKDIRGRLREFFRNGGRKNLKVKSKWIKKW